MQLCPICHTTYGDETRFCPEDGSNLIKEPTPLETVIDGRYQLKERIGDGGFGEVYCAEHVSIGKRVAIKLLRGPFSKMEEFRLRFEREAKAASRLSHLHCVQVTDFGVTEEGPYLVMELLEGRPLSKVLAEGRLSRERALEISRQILSALAHAHAQGIVHRDLKPGNVMLVSQAGARGDFVKIMDFGLAKIYDPAGDKGGLTQTGAILGTPAYMSPEQAAGGTVDHRSDLYSMGLLLYELVLGRRPFRAKENDELLRAHIFLDPDPPRSIDPTISEELEEVLKKALQKSKEQRYQSAEEFLQDLGETPELNPAFAAAATLPEGAPSPAITKPKSTEIATRNLRVPAALGTLPTQQALPAPEPPEEEEEPLPAEEEGPSITQVTKPKRRTGAIFATLFLLGVAGGAFALFQEEILGWFSAPVAKVPSPQEPPRTITDAAAIEPSEEEPENDLADEPVSSSVPVSEPASPPPANEPGAAPPPIILDPARSTLQAEEYWAKKNWSRMQKELKSLMAQEPRNARVHYLYGVYYYENDYLVDALKYFRQAIEYEEAYAYDETLLKYAAGAFKTNFSKGHARRFFMEALPRDIAIKTLAETAARGETAFVREEAANTLRAMGAKDQIDWVAKASLDFKQATWCRDREAAIKELGQSKDKRALDFLRKLEAEDPQIHRCGIQNAIQKAIKTLEAE